MKQTRIARYTLAIAIGAFLSVSPALAQGKGRGQDRSRDRQEQARPELRRRADDVRKEISPARSRRQPEVVRREYDARRDYQLSRGRSRGVPPGWCVRGNPHNTIENCGYSAQRSRNGGYYEDRYYYGGSGRSSSYSVAHSEFHRYLDRKYSELAARRPLDIPRQLRLRLEKQREHDEWHRRMGRSH